MKINGHITDEPIALRLLGRRKDFVVLSKYGAEIPDTEVVVLWLTGDSTTVNGQQRSVAAVQFENGRILKGVINSSSDRMRYVVTWI